MDQKDHDYAYFDHDADIGIIGRGATLTDAFIAAAKGVFAIMTDIDAVKPLQSVSVDFEEADRELAFVMWLNLLLAKARAHGLMFGDFELQANGSHWHGVAYGMTWQRNLVHGVEVKGATLTALSVRQQHNIWEARCIVDV
jgi:SHS2 domain-containing protein